MAFVPSIFFHKTLQLSIANDMVISFSIMLELDPEKLISAIHSNIWYLFLRFSGHKTFFWNLKVAYMGCFTI